MKANANMQIPNTLMQGKSPLKYVMMTLCAAGFSSCAWAGLLNLQVSDAAGRPVADAIVYAEAVGAPKSPRVTATTATIEQKSRKFIPLVTAVQVGTPVSFPNNDKVRHQVYSFSPAKTFELKLYSGVPAQPVVFDKSGTVVMGCNIHDRMLAYVHVVDPPFFSKTDPTGKTVLSDLPLGRYLVKTWHPALPENVQSVEQAIQVTTSPADLNVKLDIDASTAAN